MPPSKNHIVIPIDFSEQSLIAVEQSYNLARFTESDLTLLHVMDEEHFFNLRNLVSDHSHQEELIRESAMNRLNSIASDVKAKSGLNVVARIEKGKIYDVIVEVAESLDTNFIIMGTNGTPTLRKKFIGSNAVRVINQAHCPVITIKGLYHGKGCQTILLPLDLSKETKEKVGQCIAIAKFFNSTVRVMTVVNTKDEFLFNKLERQMDQVVEFITEAGIKCTGEFHRANDISEGVLFYADVVKADLIIIMTQNELEWTEFFIGTESQQIINHSPVPVCSIRPIPKKDNTEFVIS